MQDPIEETILKLLLAQDFVVYYKPNNLNNLKIFTDFKDYKDNDIFIDINIIDKDNIILTYVPYNYLLSKLNSISSLLEKDNSKIEYNRLIKKIIWNDYFKSNLYSFLEIIIRIDNTAYLSLN